MTIKNKKPKNGRPVAYENPLEMLYDAQRYFALCEKNKVLPEKAGLALSLGINRDTLLEYSKKEKFSGVIKKMNDNIESAWVKRLGSNSPVGAIFYLKNVFKESFKDRTETDLTSKGEKIIGINYIIPKKPNEAESGTNV